MDLKAIENELNNYIFSEGLLYLGIVDLAHPSSFDHFQDWLQKGKHAEMSYLLNHRDIRKNPTKLLSGAKNAIIIALNYYQGDKLTKIKKSKYPVAAQYARFKDYHKTLQEKGNRILKSILGHFEDHHGKVFVDSAPILERALAQKTRAGFIGKNTCYIHPEWGSYLLLAEIFTTIPFSVDTPQNINPKNRIKAIGGCGDCKRCQINCPTGALREDYKLDANLCISYWTIENRSTIPEKFWPHLKHYFFGCDLCQLACPYNRTARLSPELKLINMPTLFEIATMDEIFYEQRFGGTPLTRAKRFGLRRNALIAMTVTYDPLLNKALSLIDDNDHEVIRATAEQIKVWKKAHWIF